MKLILIPTLIFLLSYCSKEYSCEDCIEQPIVDTSWTDTIPGNGFNQLISYYSFYIVDNSKIKKIYFCVKTKYHPGHYYIHDSIPIQDRPDGYYNGSFNLKNYLDMSKYVKNDTFPVFYQIRYRNGDLLQTDSATLVY